MRHSIFVDLQLDDEQELEAFATQASIVQPADMEAEIVLDAIGVEAAHRLRTGRIATAQYSEGEHDYLICFHPPVALMDSQARSENEHEHEALKQEWVRPDEKMPLPMDAKSVRHALSRGGGRIHAGLMRLEALVSVTPDMARSLLAGHRVPLENPGQLLQQPVAGYELFIPQRLRPGQVEYRRIH